MVQAWGTVKSVTSPSTNSAHKLIACVYFEHLSGGVAGITITPNNGGGTWTLIARVNGTTGDIAAALYVGLGGYTTSFTISEDQYGGLQVWATSGSDLGATVDAHVTSQDSDTTHNLGSLTTVADNCMVFAAAVWWDWFTGKSSAAFNTEDDETDAVGMYHHTVLKTPAGAFGAASVVHGGSTTRDSVGIIFSIAPPGAGAASLVPPSAVRRLFDTFRARSDIRLPGRVREGLHGRQGRAGVGGRRIGVAGAGLLGDPVRRR